MEFNAEKNVNRIDARKIVGYNCELFPRTHIYPRSAASIEITLARRVNLGESRSRKKGEAAGSTYTRRESRGMKSPRREKTYGL